MENTTKALLMAVGVIIGVLIFSVFVWTFRKGGQMLGAVDSRKESEVIAEYNSKLIIYNRDNNNIFDVVTACNLAFDINTQNMFDNSNGLSISVTIPGNTYVLQRDDASQEKGKISGAKLTELITRNMGMREVGEENISTTLSTVEKRTDGIEVIQEYIYTFTGRVGYDNTGKINQIDFNLN